MINWRNVLENLINQVINGILMIIMAYVIIGQFEGMMQEAIAKNTTEIKNEFNTEIKKLKAYSGSKINLTTSPTIDNKAQTIITKDSVPEKKGFFKKLFGKKSK